MISLWFTINLHVPIWPFLRIISSYVSFKLVRQYGSVNRAVVFEHDTKCEWVRFPVRLITISIVIENHLEKRNNNLKKNKSNDGWGGFGREDHLQSVLRPFLPITLYLESPWVVYDKAFLFRHILETFHVSAAISKRNCLSIAKHLFTIGKPLLWERLSVSGSGKMWKNLGRT